MSKEVHVICDNIRSLYNVGSIFRTADALGVAQVWLGGITGTPEQKGVKKVALGAEETVAWEYVKQPWRAVEQLKRRGFKVVALELTKDSQNVKVFKPKFPLVLIVGNEVAGVSPALLNRCDAIVHIPMKGMKESLNVSVAFGIAAYEIINKQ
ncbi:MAG: RNA methyltransferase [Patescibacteria group bacterium]|jgi:tRNA G18 (ribose-2'-O)-methylase SpoU